MANLSAMAIARVKAIMNSDEAKGREAQAAHLANSTTESFESAVAILALSPAGPTADASAKAGWAKAVAKANAGRGQR